MSFALTDADSNLQPINFYTFRLDLRAGELTDAGTPIPLRPKTWAVLVHLASRPGILVTKEELLNAVWPDVAVTPDTLTKSIGELRLVLGDDPITPRFIATVHRRGFRFVGKMHTVPAAEASAALPEPTMGDTGGSPFIGRAAELRQLAQCFEKACAGERQFVFVTGPAGVGKTRLIDALLDSPTLRGAGAWIARATSIEQHSLREPYMPVLKALDRLSRRPDAVALAGLLRRVAPTWLAQMPWLIGDDEEALRQSLQAARAERMLREFAALAEAVSAEVPLILVLEDLHWSDPATTDLLALLAARREPARLLVIGSYRPAELVVQDHVLAPAVRAMCLQRHALELPLHEFSEADVGRYLTARFPGAELPASLSRRVYAHTDGNPLFVSAVVDQILSRGWILDTAPGWTFSPALDTVDLGLPDGARQMIETQFEALSPADRVLLEAASVAGNEFPAQAIAAAQRRGLDDVEMHCETLARSRGFLRFAGSGTWPDGAAALRYAFVHNLYRQAIYEGLPEDTRRRLHRRIGEALEAAYGERASDAAAELAAHFEYGGDPARAVRYLAAAAQLARQRFAAREAIGYLEAAIGLASELHEETERQRRELELRLALLPIVGDLHGFASDELRESCERAHALCLSVGTPKQLFQVLYALSHLHVASADIARTSDTVAQLDKLAKGWIRSLPPIASTRSHCGT